MDEPFQRKPGIPREKTPEYLRRYNMVRTSADAGVIRLEMKPAAGRQPANTDRTCCDPLL